MINVDLLTVVFGVLLLVGAMVHAVIVQYRAAKWWREAAAALDKYLVESNKLRPSPEVAAVAEAWAAERNRPVAPEDEHADPDGPAAVTAYPEPPDHREALGILNDILPSLDQRHGWRVVDEKVEEWVFSGPRWRVRIQGVAGGYVGTAHAQNIPKLQPVGCVEATVAGALRGVLASVPASEVIQ